MYELKSALKPKPWASDCDLIWKQGLCSVNQVQRRSLGRALLTRTGAGGASNPNRGILETDTEGRQRKDAHVATESEEGFVPSRQRGTAS